MQRWNLSSARSFVRRWKVFELAAPRRLWASFGFSLTLIKRADCIRISSPRYIYCDFFPMRNFFASGLGHVSPVVWCSLGHYCPHRLLSRPAHAADDLLPTSPGLSIKSQCFLEWFPLIPSESLRHTTGQLSALYLFYIYIFKHEMKNRHCGNTHTYTHLHMRDCTPAIHQTTLQMWKSETLRLPNFYQIPHVLFLFVFGLFFFTEKQNGLHLKSTILFFLTSYDRPSIKGWTTYW